MSFEQNEYDETYSSTDLCKDFGYKTPAEFNRFLNSIGFIFNDVREDGKKFWNSKFLIDGHCKIFVHQEYSQLRWTRYGVKFLRFELLDDFDVYSDEY